MEAKEKFCVDCKHYRYSLLHRLSGFIGPRCHNPKNAIVDKYLDRVTGRCTTTVQYLSCEFNREMKCGKEGKLFEQRN